MELKEIYYVDEKRLSHYVNQIEKSPKTYDKGSKFKIELAWPSPKLGFEQTRDVRDRTTTEQIEIVRDYLEKTEQLNWQRPTKEEERSPFVLEYIRAAKVIVPSSAEKGINTPNFVFWLSEGSEDGVGMLCLLEDFRRADEPPTNFRSASTYTVLQSLVYFTREQLRSTVLNLHIPDDPHPNPYAKFDNKPQSLSEYHNIKDYAWEFLTNPVQLLHKWGCIVSPPRNIEVLYRIREFGRDSGHGWERVTVFGYPIWIREGNT